MPRRIEDLADALERLGAARARQHVHQPPMDQLDAAAERIVRGAGRRQRGQKSSTDLEQEFADDVARGGLAELAAFAVDALAIVVELGGGAKQAIVPDRHAHAAGLRARPSPASRLKENLGSRLGSVQHAGHHLRQRVDSGDGPVIAHARRPDDADGAHALAVAIRRRDDTERLQIRRRMLGPDDDRQAEVIEGYADRPDAFAQQRHEAMLLFDHANQRARGFDCRLRRLGRGISQLIEEQRRALHVQAVVDHHVGEARLRQAKGTRDERVVERALFTQLRDDGRSDLLERHALEGRVDEIGGLSQLDPFRAACPCR